MPNKAAAVFFDLLFLVCFFIFFTGFLPFAPPEIYSFFGEKPLIHRVLTSAAAALGILLLFWRMNSSFIVRGVKKISLSSALWPWLIFMTSGTIWTCASWARHQAFKSGFDMAIFTQSVWNTVHGSFLYSSIKGGICLLGDHFSPLLAAFALPFALWPKPESLLFFQAFIAAASVFPLYRLAQRKTGNSAWALCVILSFSLYLPLRNSVRFEFHPEIAAIPLLLWAYVFLSEKKTFFSSLMLVLALSTKESLAPVTCMFGFYSLLFSKQRLFAAFWIIVSPIYLYLVTKVWIPAISGQEYFYLSGNFMAWKEEGAGAFIKHLINPGAAAYLIKIYLPVAGFSVLDPSFLLNLPALAQNLTSRNEATRSIFFQYTATLTPFVFISAVETLKRFYPKKAAVGVFLMSGILMSGVSDIFVTARFQQERQGANLLNQAFSAIPDNASVRTHEFFAPHLANRKELHIFENNHPLEGGSEKARNTDFVIVHARLLGADAETKLAPVREKYRLSYEKDGLMVFQK